MKNGIALSALVFAFGLSLAHAQDAAPQRLVPAVAVGGHAFRDAEPDRATIGVGVTIDRPKAANASADAAKLAQALVAEIKAAGIDAKDIQTSSISVSPLFTQATSSAASSIRAWRASDQLTVRIRELDKAGPLIQRLTDAGATNLSGPSFDVSTADRIEDELRGDAAKDARRKAEIYASALGLKIGRVLYIATGGAAPQPMMRMRAMPTAASPSSPPPVEAGTQRISTDVSVEFELLQ